MILLASPLAACGRTVTVGPGRVLHLTVSEYRIQPQSVRAGSGPLTIEVRDSGRLVHNLALLNSGHVAAATPPIRPGGTSKLVVALSPGTYIMASTMFFDQSLGAYGTLTITR